MSAPPAGPRERTRLFAFVDASAFYCSCERLFRPELRSRPVVVLSNNDGCVIALTEEAKALGVPMGAPYYKIRDQLARDGVTVFSSNYALYHDLSSRVMQVLGRFSPHVEAYSIDEAFLELDADPRDPSERARLEALARDIRQAVWAATRIPVRVSIAETKTLAKVGAEHARTLASPTVCFWKHPDRNGILARLPVGEVWGVGPRWAKRLRGDGAITAAGLAALPDDYVRRHYNVVLLRTVLELRGVSCLPLDRCPPTRKSLIRSRMFGTPLTDPALIGRAVGLHASTAAAMLRDQALAAQVVEVFVTTGRHAARVHHGRAMVELATPTNDTFALVRAARSLVASCVRVAADGSPTRYKKAGVMLTGLGPAGQGQADLFRPGVRERPALMEAIDGLTQRFGAGTVAIAAQGTPDELRAVLAGVPGAAWGMKREHLSSRATTWWTETLSASMAPWAG